VTDPQDRETADIGRPLPREPSTDDQDRAPGAIAIHRESSEGASPAAPAPPAGDADPETVTNPETDRAWEAGRETKPVGPVVVTESEGAGEPGAEDAPSTEPPPEAHPPARDVDATDAVEPAAATPRRAVLSNARIAWLVAGLAVLGLIALSILAVPALRAEGERAEVQDRAEVIAARVTTFEGANIEEWIAETRALATGAYARQLDDVFDLQLREALRDNEVESVGQIQRSFVQLIDGDRAEVFVLARQSSVNAQRPQPVEDELRIEIELRREDGEWLASDIAVLGPQQPGGPVPPPAPAEGDE
jgi:Mce-associated membrane protein